MCWTWPPWAQVGPRESEFLEGAVCSCPSWQGLQSGAQTSPQTSDQLSRVPTEIWPPSTFSWGCSCRSPFPLPSTIRLGLRGPPQREGLAVLPGDLLAVPSLAPRPFQAEEVTLASGPSHSQALDNAASPRILSSPGPQRQPGPVVPGRPGHYYPKRLSGTVGGQGPRVAPMPYLGQQPEGEEEPGVHGATGRGTACGQSCASGSDRTPLSDSTSAQAEAQRVSDCTWAGKGLVLNDSTSVRAGDPVSDSTSVRAGPGRGQVSDLCMPNGGGVVGRARPE